MRLFLIELPAELNVGNETFDRLSRLLDEEAQARIKKFRLPEDALRSLVGRLAPIWYLFHASLVTPNISSSSIKFGKKGKGKPTLVEPSLNPPLAFNTSHDGRYVLLGVSRGTKPDSEPETGVDLMQLPKDPWDLQEAISEQLVREEKATLALPLTSRQHARLLTTLWTFKEGYVKATGDGVGFGLERIRVDLDTHEEGRVHGVYVDGRDISLDGWAFDHGLIGTGEATGAGEKVQGEAEYGWAAFWKVQIRNTEQTTDGNYGRDWRGVVERIRWEDFTSRLLDPSTPEDVS